jgi:hypothetical protein
MVKKIPVFNFKQDPSQVGRGPYKMIACFVVLGVHVPYTVTIHDGEEYLNKVGEPSICDETCEQRQGTIENWSKERSDREHTVQSIIESAENFGK